MTSRTHDRALLAGWGKRIGELLDRRDAPRLSEYPALFGRARSAVGEFRNEVRVPDIEFVHRLCKHFGVPVEWVIDGRIGHRPVDQGLLTDALEIALMSVEAMRAKGKDFTPDQIAKHALAVYEIEFAKKVDTPISVDKTKSAPGLKVEEFQSVAGNENGDHEVHRGRRAGKR